MQGSNWGSIGDVLNPIAGYMEQQRQKQDMDALLKFFGGQMESDGGIPGSTGTATGQVQGPSLPPNPLQQAGNGLLRVLGLGQSVGLGQPRFGGGPNVNQPSTATSMQSPFGQAGGGMSLPNIKSPAMKMLMVQHLMGKDLNDLQKEELFQAQNYGRKKAATDVGMSAEDLRLKRTYGGLEKATDVEARSAQAAADRALADSRLNPQVAPDKQIDAIRLRNLQALEEKVNSGTATPQEQEAYLRAALPGGGVNVTTNVGTEKPLPEGPMGQIIGASDTLNTINELDQMMAPARIDPTTKKIIPAGVGTEMVGFWDNAVAKAKQGVGSLSPDEAVFNQKYVRLQTLLRTLNAEGRLSDKDAERLKDAVPSKVLNNAAFRGALKEYKKYLPEKMKLTMDAYKEVGYSVPSQTIGAKQSPEQFKVGETRTVNGKVWYYKGNNKWTDQR